MQSIDKRLLTTSMPNLKYDIDVLSIKRSIIKSQERESIKLLCAAVLHVLISLLFIKTGLDLTTASLFTKFKIAVLIIILIFLRITVDYFRHKKAIRILRSKLITHLEIVGTEVKFITLENKEYSYGIEEIYYNYKLEFAPFFETFLSERIFKEYKKDFPLKNVYNILVKSTNFYFIPALYDDPESCLKDFLSIDI